MKCFISRSRNVLSGLALCGVASIANNAFAGDARDAADAFLTRADQVLAELQKADPSEQFVTSTIDAMLDDAAPVVTSYGELHTQCAAQLAKVIELYPQINLWTAQEIRRNIEGAQALPQADGCYPARDIVAHPAIVRVLSRTEITAASAPRLVREMNEAVEHMEEIRATLPGNEQ